MGLHGAVYDITQFAPAHPGSADTLLDFAGTNATAFFEDVGHSTVARRLMKSMLLLGPRDLCGGCLRCVKRALEDERIALAKRHPTKLCPRCHNEVHFDDAALFYDAVRASWVLWWPCCGERLVDAVPPHADLTPDWRNFVWRRRVAVGDAPETPPDAGLLAADDDDKAARVADDAGARLLAALRRI